MKELLIKLRDYVEENSVKIHRVYFLPQEKDHLCGVVSCMLLDGLLTYSEFAALDEHVIFYDTKRIVDNSLKMNSIYWLNKQIETIKTT